MLTKYYHFEGWFVKRATACIEVDEELTKEEIKHYLSEGLYDLDWEKDRDGEIVDARFVGVESDGQESYAE